MKALVIAYFFGEKRKDGFNFILTFHSLLLLFFLMALVTNYMKTIQLLRAEY